MVRLCVCACRGSYCSIGVWNEAYISDMFMKFSSWKFINLSPLIRYSICNPRDQLFMNGYRDCDDFLWFTRGSKKNLEFAVNRYRCARRRITIYTRNTPVLPALSVISNIRSESFHFSSSSLHNAAPNPQSSSVNRAAHCYTPLHRHIH